MSNKKSKNTNKISTATVEDRERNKYGKAIYYILFDLIGGIFFCLMCGWISRDTEFNAISDNIVTSLIQNYNYVLGAVLLIPVIAYVYSKIKKELNGRLDDSQIITYGFLAFTIILIAVISVCSIVYPINSSTWYGKNSAVTVSMFLCSFVTFALLCLTYGILRLVDMSKDKGKLWKSIKKYSPIILMVMFIIWTFISCMLAPNAADDIIGAKAAKEAGAAPSEVLSKTLNGCYNLKDGFWAFLLYGSVMIATMLIPKDKIKEKKRLIIGFVIVMTALSILSLSMTAYSNYNNEKYAETYKEYLKESGEIDLDKKLTKADFDKYAQSESYSAFTKWYIYPQRAVFRNSNHFAYVLCMSILAAAGLAIFDKKIINKLLYLLAFTIMMCMLIVNDTFGGYLGVTVALIALLIYAICYTFSNKNATENVEGALIRDSRDSIAKKQKIYDLITMVLLVAIFATTTFTVNVSNGKSSEIRNIENFVRDIGVFGGFMINEENATEVDITELDDSVRYAGSHRGETWLKVWELIKQRPMFGYGLECLLFQFSGQFGVNEGRTHNLLLQLLATIGIPGTIMYFSALAIVFIRLLKNWKTWDDIEKITTFVGIAYIVTALTGNSTYYTSPFFMMFLGFVVLTPWKRENK